MKEKFKTGVCKECGDTTHDDLEYCGNCIALKITACNGKGCTRNHTMVCNNIFCGLIETQSHFHHV